MNDRLLTLLARCYRSVDRRGHLLVLTYHRVGGGATISRQHVQDHLAFLAKNYDIVLPSQFLRGRHGKRVAMVTIDDCHEDAYTEIFPVARALGVPITVCVPTDFFLRERWLWFDKLNWAFAHADDAVLASHATQKGPVDDQISLSAQKARLKLLPREERDRQISAILDRLGVALPSTLPRGYRPVARNAMQDMLASGLVELCAHTVTHPIATRVSEEDWRWEARRSKQELEEIADQEVVSFCYPNGGAGDFDDRTGAILGDVGFRMAFTTVPGLNHTGAIRIFELRRIHVHPKWGVFQKETSGMGSVQRVLRLTRARP